MSAVLVSFVGSLPPGTTNLMTVKLVITDGSFSAVKFALGCMIAEACYALASLVMMDKIIRIQAFMKVLQGVSLALLLLLTAYSFKAAFYTSAGINDNELSRFDLAPLTSGFLLMILNPVQLPFWLGWTTLFFERKLIRPTFQHYAGYIAGIGLGSLLASILFIFAGQYFAMSKDVSGKTLYIAMGCFFMLSSLVQAAKMIRKKFSADPWNEVTDNTASQF